jgi:hypothetical protein
LLATGVLGAILAGSVVITPKRLLAQVKYALVRDEDSPARNAFQATFTMNGGLAGGSVSIPAGKRLVVDFVEAHGTAFSTGGPIQPTVVLSSNLTGSPSINYYLPLQVETNGINQFTETQKVAVYSDYLAVNMGYSGYAPSSFVFVVNVSGHFIDMP